MRRTWVVFSVMVGAILGLTALIAGGMWLAAPKEIRTALAQIGVLQSVAELDVGEEPPPLDEAGREACIERPTADCLRAWALAEARTVSYEPSRARMLARIATDWRKPRLFAEAFAAAEAIRPRGSRVYFMGQIAQHQVKAGRIDDAVATADSLLGWARSDQVKFTVVLSVANSGRFVRALEIAKSIRAPDRRLLAISQVISAQTTVGPRDNVVGVPELEAALEDHGKRPKLSGSELKGIVTALAKAGRVANARRLALSITDAYSRGLALTDVAEATQRPKDIQDAIRTAGEIAEERSRLWTLAQIGARFASAGNMQAAYEVIASLPDNSGTEESMKWARSYVLREIAKSHARNDRAKHLFAVLDQFDSSDSLRDAIVLVLGACEPGPITDRMVDLAIENNFADPWLVFQLIRLQKPDRAIAVAERIADTGDHAEALRAVGVALRDPEFLESALRLAQEARSARKPDDDPEGDPDDDELIWRIAVAYAQIGDPRKAFEIVRSQSSPVFQVYAILDIAAHVSARASGGAAMAAH